MSTTLPSQSLIILPATTLADSSSRLQLDPVGPDSSLYLDLGAARGTKELGKLEIHLRNAARQPNAWAHCAFIGNRGSGKSSFLLNLERRFAVAQVFTPVHIYLDPSLESDCEYSDLFLWMVDQIAAAFQLLGHPVDDAALSKIVIWFADKTYSSQTEWKKEIGLEASAEAEAKTGLPYIFSLKLLARLKSMVSGSEATRKEIRRKAQNYASELLELVNEFLDHAHDTLRAAGKPTRLLIVQDNLDRIRSSEKARQLFDSGADMLLGLRADVIYTAPLAINIAPLNLANVFQHVFTMPNVKLWQQNGDRHDQGVNDLVKLVAKRLSVPDVFDAPATLLFLIDQSGGSVRELLRLLDEAQLDAQVDEKTKVDMVSARTAAKKLAIQFVRLLQPGSAYYPILVAIHQTKRGYDPADGAATVSTVTAARAFFSELIGMGCVLEYNGDDSWYDVLPPVRDTLQFKDALQKTQAN
ncbi:hypothetical protein BH10PSE16_BH10PSE16_09580 [soil metagenome]